MRLLLIATMFLVATPHAFAQFATPMELVDEIFDAMNSQDAQRASRTMHPEALAELKRFFVEVETMVPDESMFELPEGISFSTMSPEEIYEWLLMTSVFEGEMTMNITYDYLGEEKVGDLLHVLVKTHVTIDDFKMSNEETITMKQHEGGWLAMLSGDIETYLAMMRAFISD